MVNESSEQVLKDWRNERNRFPGWVVVPWHNRESLFGLKADLWRILEFIKNQTAKDRIEPLELLVWRCEKALNLPGWLEGTSLDHLHQETTLFIRQSLSQIPKKHLTVAFNLLVSRLRQRIYEKKNGILPSALEALSKVGIDVSKVKPLGDKPFGYKVEDQVATLWGFSLQEHIETPDTPPISDESNENAEQNRMWVWSLPARVRRR